MANLVTDLSGQEGGQVGLETLLQTLDRKNYDYYKFNFF
jgi:hypothetical protein